MTRWLLALLLFCCSPPVFADDCPDGHIRNPAITPLDHGYMLSAYKASFVGIFGRQPTMVPGSGVDDGEYYIASSNHYGVYGDDQCHAGWSGYWESWLHVGHGDLSLVQSPARFQPSVTPPPPPPPPLPIFSDAAILAAIQHAHVAEMAAIADVGQNVTDGRAENRGFFDWVKDNWKQLLAVIGPVYATWQACHSTGGC